MQFVVREDIIAYIEETKNVLQGDSVVYDILLYKDFIGNDLNASRASNISVAVLDRNGKKVLMYNSPVIPGVSDILSVGSVSNGDPGRISFEINAAQSRLLSPGDLNVAITIIYADFFPSSKTYNLPTFKLGQVIEVIDPTVPVDPTLPGLFLGSPQFTIENISAEMPSSFGKMSVNANNPNEITEIIFRNLDKNQARLTTLENFIVNRIGVEEIEGTITLYSLDNSLFYTIFKVVGWERIDIDENGNNEENGDAIKLIVAAENTASGPGVTKSTWDIGNNVAFSIDAFGSKSVINEINGIFTISDKNLKVATETNGNFSPTGIFITYTPYSDSYVLVEVNGISVEVGDGTRDKGCYFSDDGGETAILIKDIKGGDELIWNGEIVGFELEINDDINLIYEVDSDFSTGDTGVAPGEGNGFLTTDDKNIEVEVETAGDNALTGIFITNTPYKDSYVMVEVNGISAEVGDGVKDTDCYFSGDNGVTAEPIKDIRSGDQLIWNGSIAGYELSPGDQINLIYEVDIDVSE